MTKKYVLGIHVGHDRAVALIQNGIVVGNIAQERLDRIKHSRSIELPYDSINAILKYNHITIKDISCVGLSGDAMEKECIFETLKLDLYQYFHYKLPVYLLTALTFLNFQGFAVCLTSKYVSFSLVFALMSRLQGKVFVIQFSLINSFPQPYPRV